MLAVFGEEKMLSSADRRFYDCKLGDCRSPRRFARWKKELDFQFVHRRRSSPHYKHPRGLDGGGKSFSEVITIHVNALPAVASLGTFCSVHSCGVDMTAMKY
jgi:hypothetical protein